MKSEEILKECIGDDEQALIVVYNASGDATSDANPHSSVEAELLICIALMTIRNTAKTNGDENLATKIDQIITQFFSEIKISDIESKSTPLGTFQ